MPETIRAIHLLVSIAKVDGDVSTANREREAIPAQLAKMDRRIAEIDVVRERARDTFAALDRERRDLEARVRDGEATVNSLKNKLMAVKNNKEYQAMLKEIENVKVEVDQHEERLLVLFDEIEQAGPAQKQELERIASERRDTEQRKAAMTARAAELDSRIAALRAEKPRLLAELSGPLCDRYRRLLARYGDSGVVNVRHEHCEGCGTQLPPQVAVEVRENNQILTCQSCGRILVYWE